MMLQACTFEEAEFYEPVGMITVKPVAHKLPIKTVAIEPTPAEIHHGIRGINKNHIRNDRTEGRIESCRFGRRPRRSWKERRMTKYRRIPTLTLMGRKVHPSA